MKVVHVITGLGQGGAEAMLEKLLLAGRASDPQIAQSVVCLGRVGAVGERLLRAGFTVRALELSLSAPLSLLKLRLLGGAVKAPGNEAVVIQTWLWHADLLGGLLARLRGNPRVVWNVRNSMPALASTKLRSRGVAWLCARLSRRVPQRIVCNSRAALRAHVAIGYDADKCVVLPNGFDLTTFARREGARSSTRAAWGVADDDLLVGMVARVDAQKDHATFLRAASIVAGHVARARFVLVGAGVTTDHEIRALLEELQLTGRVVLEERREDINNVMAGLDIFCLASRSEGFPNVLGEAMASSTPSVTTDAGDSAQIVGDPRFVCPVGDAPGLAACLQRVLEMPAGDRAALGAAQRRSIEERFSIAAVWSSYRDLYESL